MVPVCAAAGTEPSAIFTAEGPHGQGEEKVLLDDPLQQDLVFAVGSSFEVVRGEFELPRLDALAFLRTQDLTDGHLYGVLKGFQAATALERHGHTGFALDEHVLSVPPYVEFPLRCVLDGKSLQTLPSGVLASKTDVYAVLRNVRKGYLHDLQDPVYVGMRILTYYLFMRPYVKPNRRLTPLLRFLILGVGMRKRPTGGRPIMLRRAAYAGDWYPGSPERLRDALAAYMGAGVAENEAVGVVAPHAGYLYSGSVAGAVYGRIRIPETVVVLCVNHRGLGARAALQATGQWETPLGRVPVRQDFAEALMENVGFLEEDSTAHSQEHSLEMQVPFLQYRNEEVSIVPVSLQLLDYDECATLGEGLARTVRDFSTHVLLVASTDMTHFESREEARRKDMLAIDRVLEVDPQGLYRVVTSRRISMCGFVPTTAVLCACRSLGVSKGTLVEYATSGDVTGDDSSVVGYAGISLP